MDKKERQDVLDSIALMVGSVGALVLCLAFMFFEVLFISFGVYTATSPHPLHEGDPEYIPPVYKDKTIVWTTIIMLCIGGGCIKFALQLRETPPMYNGSVTSSEVAIVLEIVTLIMGILLIISGILAALGETEPAVGLVLGAIQGLFVMHYFHPITFGYHRITNFVRRFREGIAIDEMAEDV